MIGQSMGNNGSQIWGPRAASHVTNRLHSSSHWRAAAGVYGGHIKETENAADIFENLINLLRYLLFCCGLCDRKTKILYTGVALPPIAMLSTNHFYYCSKQAMRSKQSVSIGSDYHIAALGSGLIETKIEKLKQQINPTEITGNEGFPITLRCNLVCHTKDYNP